MTSRSDFKLCCHEIVTQFLPIHWSSLTASSYTQISLVENAKESFGVHYGKFEAHCTVRRSRPLWRGMHGRPSDVIRVFRRTQYKHCKASSEIWKLQLYYCMVRWLYSKIVCTLLTVGHCLLLWLLRLFLNWSRNARCNYYTLRSSR